MVVQTNKINVSEVKEFKKQVYGCFAFNDTLSEVRRSINNITKYMVKDIKRCTIGDKDCFVLTTKRKDAIIQKIYRTDDLTTKIDKQFKNSLVGLRMDYIYIDKIKQLRRNIPYLEE